jgi:hypothetical protein
MFFCDQGGAIAWLVAEVLLNAVVLELTGHVGEYERQTEFFLYIIINLFLRGVIIDLWVKC